MGINGGITLAVLQDDEHAVMCNLSTCWSIQYIFSLGQAVEFRIARDGIRLSFSLSWQLFILPENIIYERIGGLQGQEKAAQDCFTYVYHISVHFFCWRSTFWVAEALWLHGWSFRMCGLTKALSGVMLLHGCSHPCAIAESVSAISPFRMMGAVHFKTVQVGRTGGLQDENNIAQGVHHQVGSQTSSAFALDTLLSTPLVSFFFFARPVCSLACTFLSRPASGSIRMGEFHDVWPWHVWEIGIQLSRKINVIMYDVIFGMCILVYTTYMCICIDNYRYVYHLYTFM